MLFYAWPLIGLLSTMYQFFLIPNGINKNTQNIVNQEIMLIRHSTPVEDRWRCRGPGDGSQAAKNQTRFYANCEQSFAICYYFGVISVLFCN